MGDERKKNTKDRRQPEKTEDSGGCLLQAGERGWRIHRRCLPASVIPKEKERGKSPILRHHGTKTLSQKGEEGPDVVGVFSNPPMLLATTEGYVCEGRHRTAKLRPGQSTSFF